MYNYGFAQMALARGVEAVATDCMVNVLRSRRRGFASDGEAWAELKVQLAGMKKEIGGLEKLHGEMWDEIKAGNEDAFMVMVGAMYRSAEALAAAAVLLGTLAKIAEEDPPIPEDETEEESEQEAPEG